MAKPRSNVMIGLGEQLRKRFEIADQAMDDRMRRLLDALMVVSSHRETQPGAASSEPTDTAHPATERAR